MVNLTIQLASAICSEEHEPVLYIKMHFGNEGHIIIITYIFTYYSIYVFLSKYRQSILSACNIVHVQIIS